MRLNLELSQAQIQILISLIDQFKMGIDEYINLAHDLEATLDEIYS